MKKILFILGTRPEAIKLAPLILELRKQKSFNVLICNTEQQKELSNQTLKYFEINSDFQLNVMRKNQSLEGVQSRLLLSLSEVFKNNHIDATIVQGDTITAFCGALSSFYNKVPIFHVEAGLRSYNLFEPFPEEAIRQMVARIIDIHFAPTKKAYDALIKENICEEKIFITGNTVIDALKCLSEQTLKLSQTKLEMKGILFNDKLVLVTVHRRENHGERLDEILSAIKYLAQEFSDHQFIIPVHPNPNVHNKVYDYLDSIRNVILTGPLEYPELVCLIKNTKLILTDSGGIQEEAPTFGNPCLVMRYKTERIEGVEAGFSKLVGADENKIISESKLILSQDRKKTRLDGSKNPYGDGSSASVICDRINKYFSKH